MKASRVPTAAHRPRPFSHQPERGRRAARIHAGRSRRRTPPVLRRAHARRLTRQTRWDDAVPTFRAMAALLLLTLAPAPCESESQRLQSRKDLFRTESEDVRDQVRHTGCCPSHAGARKRPRRGPTTWRAGSRRRWGGRTPVLAVGPKAAEHGRHAQCAPLHESGPESLTGIWTRRRSSRRLSGRVLRTASLLGAGAASRRASRPRPSRGSTSSGTTRGSADGGSTRSCPAPGTADECAGTRRARQELRASRARRTWPAR
jgi:hypothetical protein